MNFFKSIILSFLFCSTSTGVVFTQNLYKSEYDLVDNEEDLACMAKVSMENDPCLGYLINKVKQDLGIEKDILICWLFGRNDFTARYHFNHDFITVSDIYSRGVTCHEYRRFILVHELEHHRQFKRYFGSYKNFERDRDKKAFWLALEQGADATAAGYIECEECLKKIAELRMREQIEEHLQTIDTDCGIFTSEKGYFTKKDFEPYIQRARDEKCICRACWKDLNCNSAYSVSNQDYVELVKQGITVQERFELCSK